jgi:hypothetical protein
MSWPARTFLWLGAAIVFWVEIWVFLGRADDLTLSQCAVLWGIVMAIFTGIWVAYLGTERQDA